MKWIILTLIIVLLASSAYAVGNIATYTPQQVQLTRIGDKLNISYRDDYAVLRTFFLYMGNNQTYTFQQATQWGVTYDLWKNKTNDGWKFGGTINLDNTPQAIKDNGYRLIFHLEEVTEGFNQRIEDGVLWFSDYAYLNFTDIQYPANKFHILNKTIAYSDVWYDTVTYDPILTDTTDIGSGTRASFLNRIFYSPSINRYTMLWIDSANDLNLSSYNTTDGWVSGSTEGIITGSYDYDDFDCKTGILDDTLLHCTTTTSSADNIQYNSIDLTATSPYIPQSDYRDQAFDCQTNNDCAGGDDFEQVRIAQDSAGCVYIMGGYENSSDLQHYMMITKENTCGNGAFATADVDPRYPIFLKDVKYGDVPAFEFVHYDTDRFYIFVINKTNTDSLDKNMRVYKFDNDSLSFTFTEQIDDFAKSQIADLQYTSTSGDNRVWMFGENASGDLYVFRWDDYEDTASLKADTGLTFNLGQYHRMTATYDNVTDQLFLIWNDDSDDIEIYNSSDYGATWSLWGSTNFLNARQNWLSATFNPELCEVMIATLNGSASPYQVVYENFTTTSDCTAPSAPSYIPNATNASLHAVSGLTWDHLDNYNVTQNASFVLAINYSTNYDGEINGSMDPLGTDPSDLRLFLEFDETSGTTLSDSGPESITGITIEQSPILDVTGVYDSAINFTGTNNQRVKIEMSAGSGDAARESMNCSDENALFMSTWVRFQNNNNNIFAEPNNGGPLKAEITNDGGDNFRNIHLSIVSASDTSPDVVAHNHTWYFVGFASYWNESENTGCTDFYWNDTQIEDCDNRGNNVSAWTWSGMHADWHIGADQFGNDDPEPGLMFDDYKYGCGNPGPAWFLDEYNGDHRAGATTKSGLIPIESEYTLATDAFYTTNTSNPLTVTATGGTPGQILFNIQANGTAGTYEFFAFVNNTINQSDSARTRSINITIVEPKPPAGGDTCTYGGSGDWNILCSDNCNVGTSTVVDGDIYLNGAGNFYVNNRLEFNNLWQDRQCETFINSNYEVYLR